MKTILAIAISAAFCYSSYALAKSDADLAVDVVNNTVDQNAEICATLIETPELEGKTLKDCLQFLYRGASMQLVERAYENGKADAECATKSREILTF